jgi:homoserine dehydrogenase
MRAFIVGKGRIGSALGKELESRGWEVSFFTSQDDRATFLRRAMQSDIVALAIDTRDDGAIARSFLLEALRAGIPVVTCEKGALANYFEELEPYLLRIGYTATVGGGSRLLSLLRRPLKRLAYIRGVVNGTLNFLFWSVAQG